MALAPEVGETQSLELNVQDRDRSSEQVIDVKTIEAFYPNSLPLADCDHSLHLTMSVVEEEDHLGFTSEIEPVARAASKYFGICSCIYIYIYIYKYIYTHVYK